MAKEGASMQNKNGARGTRDVEGKVTRVGTSACGPRASFNKKSHRPSFHNFYFFLLNFPSLLVWLFLALLLLLSLGLRAISSTLHWGMLATAHLRVTHLLIALHLIHRVLLVMLS